MNLPRTVVIAGSIITVFGILFIAQSQSLVGPESSFMYRNLEWAVNGCIITAIGVVLMASGITIAFKRKDRL